MMPLVSIGLPVYNGAKFVRHALDSILAQSFTDFELIISDNGSDDQTYEICEEYAQRDSRISLYRQEENLGAARNFNFVFSKARGKYFKWAMHDDLIREDFLARCVEVFDNAPVAPVIVYPKSEFIDEAGSVVAPGEDRMVCASPYAPVRLFHFTQTIDRATPVCGLMDREMAAKTSLIGSFVGSDYVFLAEVTLLGRVIRINEPLFQRRLHEGMSRRANVSHDDALRWFDPSATTRLSIRQKLYLEYFRSVLRSPAIGLLEKLACTMSLALGIPIRRARVIAGRWRRRLVPGLNLTLGNRT